MCIEYWFLLHFENHDGNPIPMVGKSHSQSQINIINKYISRYNSTSKCKVPLYDKDSKEVNADFFDLMMAVDPQNQKRRIVNALERAKLIHDRRKKNGEEFKESVTTMYELLLRLGVFDYDEKTQSYTLFERQ